ncbi:MAG: ABC transporter ATP-binding protein [Desulfuromonadales bacterium]|nr:ABC transporter ATP-binding protein [Desulfuromonadales bacterium]
MTPALLLRNVRKSFDGPPVVKELSFAIAPGEIFGLLGPNGAGKSTTINMVAGVTRLGGGSIEVFGYDNRRDYRITRRLTGVMHQELVTDHFFTIDRALKIHSGYYGAVDDPAWRQRLIDRLGLGPHLHKSMNKLSGGLKRRLMVAKSLIHKPRLLILDEPTAGVDVELRHSLWEFVREINREGTTVLLTTHYLEEAEQMCGRIAIMNHGELIALEPTATLLSRLRDRRFELLLERPLAALPVELLPFGARLEGEGRRLILSPPPERSTGELLALICRLQLPIAEIETRRAGLEEVFLELTGMNRRPARENLG